MPNGYDEEYGYDGTIDDDYNRDYEDGYRDYDTDDYEEKNEDYFKSEYDEVYEDEDFYENNNFHENDVESDEEMERELTELEDYFQYEDEVIEEEKPKKRKKSKTRAVGSSGNPVQEGKDGAAVRDRFYLIMEDYRSGNDAKKQFAIQRAIEELDGFVHLIIRRSYSTYAKKHFHDLVQEGYVGVAVGLEKYDPSLSMPTTYFFPFIKHEMQSYITRNVDKTTSHYSANIKKINKVIDEMERRGIKVSNVDIAYQTGMTIETVDQSMAIRGYKDEVHIDACPPNVIDDKTEYSRKMSPEEEILEKESTETIYRTIHTLLTEDEIQVLTYHFGLHDTERISEGEISKRVGIPKDKVKRLLNRAIRKLRESELINMFGGMDSYNSKQDMLEEYNISLIDREATQKDIEFLSLIGDEDE